MREARKERIKEDMEVEENKILSFVLRLTHYKSAWIFIVYPPKLLHEWIGQ
jgi:hypothetical protein